MTKLSANEQKRDKAAATGRHGWARISPIIDWTCEVYAVGLLERGTRLKEEKRWGSPNRKRCIKGRNLQAKETDCNDSMDVEVQKG